MSFDNDMLCKLFIFHHLCGIRLHNCSLEWLRHYTCHCGHEGQMIRLEMHILCSLSSFSYLYRSNVVAELTHEIIPAIVTSVKDIPLSA